MAIVSLRTKWPYLKTHPGFEDALVRILFRLVSWRTHLWKAFKGHPPFESLVITLRQHSQMGWLDVRRISVKLRKCQGTSDPTTIKERYPWQR